MMALKLIFAPIIMFPCVVTTQAHEGIETANSVESCPSAGVTTQAHEGIETGGVQYISAFSVNAQ